jgi:Zn-dependent protease with chaperone function
MNVLVLLVALLATCALVASAAAACQTALDRAVHRWGWRTASAATWLRATWVVLPAVLGVLAFIVLLVPNLFSGACHCTSHGFHHPHLCVHHPHLAAPLLLPALGVTAVWLAAVVPRFYRLLREIRGAERWSRRLGDVPVDEVDGVPVRLTDGLALGAFTVGTWKPVIVVDRALWRQLTAAERRAVVHHEAAHVARRDGLTLAVLRAVTAWIPWPVGARFVSAWKAASERTCDQHAARMLGDAVSVAQALVSVERIRVGLRGSSPRSLALGVAAGADLERRVMTLLDRTDDRSAAPSLGNDLIATGMVVLGMAALALVWPDDSFHHAVEMLIGHAAP